MGFFARVGGNQYDFIPYNIRNTSIVLMMKRRIILTFHNFKGLMYPRSLGVGGGGLLIHRVFLIID